MFYLRKNISCPPLKLVPWNTFYNEIYTLMAVKSNLIDKSSIALSISPFLLSFIRRITFTKRREKVLASMYSSYVVASRYIISSMPLAWFISFSRVCLSSATHEGFILFVCLCKVKKLSHRIWDIICQELHGNHLPVFHDLSSCVFLVYWCCFGTWDWTFHCWEYELSREMMNKCSYRLLPLWLFVRCMRNEEKVFSRTINNSIIAPIKQWTTQRG